MTETFAYISPETLYDETLESYETYWDQSATIWDNFKNLLDASVALPDHKVQSPIVIAYSLCNQKWAKTLPILFLFGKEGSAKSQVIKLNRALHGATIFGGDCTFASIRNELQSMKWIDSDEDRSFHRDGAMLLFDNVYPSTFQNDEKLLSMMLRSYESGNDTVTIAGPMGENIVFKTFTSKMISSVQAFSSIHALRELNRRMIVIRTKALRDMKEDELDHVPEDILDLDSISFEGLNWEYIKFWSDAGVCHNYVQLRQKLTRKGGVTARLLSESMSEEKRKIVIDLIVTSVVSGGFSSLEASIEAFVQFFELSAKRMAGDTPASVEHFKTFIENYLIICGEGNQQIPTQEIKKIADDLNDNWKAERRLGQKEITDIMAGLGWTLDGKRNVWIPVIR